jgi:hypothetical protein
MGELILKRASASRPAGEWNEDDFDVLTDGAVVGRIFKANASPVGVSWMWTLAFGHHEDRTPTHGYAATRETAIYQCHLFDSVHTGSRSSVIIFRRGDTARVRSRGVHWRGGRSF